MEELLIIDYDGSSEWVYVDSSGKCYVKDVYDMFGTKIEAKKGELHNAT